MTVGVQDVDLSITPKVMLEGIKSYLFFMKENKLLLNVYFDPVDIVDNKEFFSNFEF